MNSAKKGGSFTQLVGEASQAVTDGTASSVKIVMLKQLLPAAPSQPVAQPRH